MIAQVSPIAFDKVGECHILTGTQERLVEYFSRLEVLPSLCCMWIQQRAVFLGTFEVSPVCELCR